MHDNDVVLNVRIAGVQVTYTVNAVHRLFLDAHSVTQSQVQKKVQNHPVALQQPNKDYAGGKHEHAG